MSYEGDRARERMSFGLVLMGEVVGGLASHTIYTAAQHIPFFSIPGGDYSIPGWNLSVPWLFTLGISMAVGGSLYYIMGNLHTPPSERTNISSSVRKNNNSL